MDIITLSLGLLISTTININEQPSAEVDVHQLLNCPTETTIDDCLKNRRAKPVATSASPTLQHLLKGTSAAVASKQGLKVYQFSNVGTAAELEKSLRSLGVSDAAAARQAEMAMQRMRSGRGALLAFVTATGAVALYEAGESSGVTHFDWDAKTILIGALIFGAIGYFVFRGLQHA
jgi:hypothetical protein